MKERLGNHWVNGGLSRDGEESTPRFQLFMEKESKTRQSEAGAADINVLMATYQKTGILPNMRPGQFMDVSEFPTYQDVMGHVAESNEIFMQLPPAIRAEFDNDPAAFLDAAVDPENRERFIQLGIFEPDPDPVPGAPPAPPSPIVNGVPTDVKV